MLHQQNTIEKYLWIFIAELCDYDMKTTYEYRILVFLNVTTDVYAIQQLTRPKFKLR